MTNRTVPAAAEGMPSAEKTLMTAGIAFLRRGEVMAIAAGSASENEATSAEAFLPAGVNPMALTGANLAELHALRDAFRTLYDVASGLSCQPRFLSSERGVYNDAGCGLDGLSELLSDALTAIGNEVHKRSPTTSEEIRLRAFTLAAQTVEDGENLPALGFDAMQAARAVVRALAGETGR